MRKQYDIKKIRRELQSDFVVKTLNVFIDSKVVALGIIADINYQIDKNSPTITKASKQAITGAKNHGNNWF